MHDHILIIGDSSTTLDMCNIALFVCCIPLLLQLPCVQSQRPVVAVKYAICGWML